MALGRRKRESQAQLWVATQNLTAPGHPFYKKLNRVLDKHGFDAFVEAQCAKYYAEGVGRPGIPPGVYFRLLMIGYFEGINSERAIAWRVADSLSLRQFLGYELDQATPDHSSVSRTRRLMDYQTHHEVFDWVLKVLAKTKLLKGKTLGVDATTLDANAAMRSIVRRDSGESYDEFLTELAKASGIETPTREDLAKVDKKRRRWRIMKTVVFSASVIFLFIWLRSIPSLRLESVVSFVPQTPRHLIHLSTTAQRVSSNLECRLNSSKRGT